MKYAGNIALLANTPVQAIPVCRRIAWSSILQTDKVKKQKILLNGCTTWTLTKRMEKKVDDNYARMLRAVLNKSWRQHPTKQQLYGHLPPITKTIQVRRSRHVGHCWRNTDELISDIPLWTPSHRRTKVRRPARTYTQQLWADRGVCLEDLPGVMDNRDGERRSRTSVLAAWHDDDDDIIIWRCSWCNGYRRRIWTRWHEFKSWTWLIAFHIALIPMGKVWIQLFSLQLWVNSRTD